MYNALGIWQSAYSVEQPELQPARSDQLKRVPPLEAQPEGAHTYLSVPLEMIPTDIALPCSLYVRISEKFVLFRQARDVLTKARADALIAPSNGVIFVSLDEWNKLIHSLEAIRIASEQAAVADSPLGHALKIRNLLLAYARQIEHSKSFPPTLLNEIQDLAARLADMIYATPSLGNDLLHRYQDPALYYVNHAVNVAIYAIAIAKKQALEAQAARTLAFAALVHNVGNIMVPAELLYKAGELTVAEKHTVDTHILHGAGLLKSLNAPKEVILTAMQHHDRYDGQGLSGRKGGDDIHLFARVCSIADVYDAITSCRPYHMNPLSGDSAIRRIQEMRGKFDPNIIPMVAARP